MQGQPHHIEILLEKNALRSIIESVARNYCIPVTTTRGYSSLSPRFDLVQRFLRSGKSKLILLMLTDFDPDGEQIAQTLRGHSKTVHLAEKHNCRFIAAEIGSYGKINAEKSHLNRKLVKLSGGSIEEVILKILRDKALDLDHYSYKRKTEASQWNCCLRYRQHAD
jgi:5S rRNA maturation endonuclease (ribonuclease M5)